MGVDLGIQLGEHARLIVHSLKTFAEKGTDETGPAGHKDAHHRPLARPASPSGGVCRLVTCLMACFLTAPRCRCTIRYPVKWCHNFGVSRHPCQQILVASPPSDLVGWLKCRPSTSRQDISTVLRCQNVVNLNCFLTGLLRSSHYRGVASSLEWLGRFPARMYSFRFSTENYT